MKMMMMFAALAAVAGMTAGCFTSAVAFTKKTAPDGTVTESKVKIVGTGDKASQIAAEGLFADGAVDDLGAGVKTASASQQSTGIKETLEGMGSLLGGIGTLMLKSQGVPVAPVAKAPASEVSAETSTAADVPDAVPAASTPKTVITAEGAPFVAILGNRATCPRCVKLWGGIDAAALSAAVDGASVIDADKTDNAVEYARLRPKEAFAYPLVAVFNADGTRAGQFDAAGMTQAQVAEKVKAISPK